MGAVVEPVIGRGVGVERPVIDFDEFYRREFAGCVVLAVAVTGERQGAEDIAQEAMFDAHRRWERIGAYDSPRGWVRRVVVQRSVKWSRRRTNERRAALRSLTGGHDGDAAGGAPIPTCSQRWCACRCSRGPHSRCTTSVTRRSLSLRRSR